VQRVQHGALLRRLLPTQGLGEPPPGVYHHRRKELDGRRDDLGGRQERGRGGGHQPQGGHRQPGGRGGRRQMTTETWQAENGRPAVTDSTSPLKVVPDTHESE
jgi:hypothetical protein